MIKELSEETKEVLKTMVNTISASDLQRDATAEKVFDLIKYKRGAEKYLNNK